MRIDRAVNLALIVLAVATVYRLTTLARSGLLWRVSRKLILSYILVGAVPILLLVTFSLLAFLLVFFDISSYLVQDRVAHLTEQASVFGRTTLFEIERAAPSERAEIIQRRQSAIASRYPGVSIALMPERPAAEVGVARGLHRPRRSRNDCAGGAVSARPAGRAMRSSSISRSTARWTRRRLRRPASRWASDRRRSLFNTATFLTYVDWKTGVSEQTPHRR